MMISIPLIWWLLNPIVLVKNLRQMTHARVQQCTQAPTASDHARVNTDVYLRAKVTHPVACKCEATFVRELVFCAQTSALKCKRVDRQIKYINNVPRAFTLDPTECEVMIHTLKGMKKKDINQFKHLQNFT